MFGTSSSGVVYWWHKLTSPGAVVLLLAVVGCLVLFAVIVAVVTVVIVFGVRHVRQHIQQQQQWQSSSNNNNNLSAMRSHHYHQHQYGKTSSALSSLSATQLILLLGVTLLLTLLITLLLITFTFLRSHYISSSSSSSSSHFLIDSDYGFSYGKIVHHFGKHKSTSTNEVSPMDIDVFSETNPNGQSFNSKYSLHDLQRMQHSRYDDPAELASAAADRAKEMAQQEEPLLSAAGKDLLGDERKKRKSDTDTDDAMSAATVVRQRQAGLSSSSSSSLTSSSGNDKNFHLSSSSNRPSAGAGQSPFVPPVSAVHVSKSSSSNSNNGNTLGGIVSAADSSLLLSGVSPLSSSSSSSSASIGATAPSAAFFHVVEHFYRPPSWTLPDLNSSSSSSTNMTLVSRQLPLAGFVDMPWQYATTARLVDLAPSRTRLCSIDHSPEHCIAKATFHHAHHVVVHLPLAEYLAKPHLAYVTRIREYARDAHVARVVVPGLGVPARVRRLKSVAKKRRVRRSRSGKGGEKMKEEEVVEEEGEEEEEERLDDETEMAVKKLHGLPVDLLVRGERTRNMLHRAGFGITPTVDSSSLTNNNNKATTTNSNVHVVGCPSLFLPDTLHLGRKWGTRLRTLTHSSSIRILFSMRAFRGYYSVVRALVRAYGSRVSFAAQTAWDLRNLEAIGIVPGENVVTVPATPEQWGSVLKDVDLVVAGRVQIGMIAMMFDVAAVAIVADEAALEMVMAMHVPFVKAEEVVSMAMMGEMTGGSNSSSVNRSNSNGTTTATTAAAMDVRELVKKSLATRAVVVGKYKWSEVEMDKRRCAIAKTYVQVYARVGLHVMTHVRNVADSC